MSDATEELSACWSRIESLENQITTLKKENEELKEDVPMIKDSNYNLTKVARHFKDTVDEQIKEIAELKDMIHNAKIELELDNESETK